MNQKRIILLIIFVFIFSFFTTVQNLLAARNVTCRAMDASGKILGVYVHSEASYPVCSCDNQDIPDTLKKSCSNSLRAF